MGKIKAHINKILGYMDSLGLKGQISFLWIFLDIAVCTIRYGATISDYFVFRFYEKKHFARKTFMTARDKRRLYAVMNDAVTRHAVQDKDVFNANFSEYLRRESISLPECGEEAFCEFFRNHETVFLKPVSTGGGEGILKVSVNEVKDPGDLYRSVSAKGRYVAEAAIVQHPDMAAMHPESINSLRIATFYDGETVKVLFAEMRCGTGDSYVDNLTAGGLVMMVDVDTGKVSSLACSKKQLNVVKHPDTNVFIPGFQIPNWDKCLQLVDRVARQTNGVHYVGWDVAVLKDDVCLIEANPGGDFKGYQETTQTGCKAEMDAIIEYMLEKRARGL